MIAWDQDHAAEILGGDWRAGEARGGAHLVSFPLADAFAELRIGVEKEEVELTLNSETGTRLENWLLGCVRVDVPDVFDEEPCITFWPQGSPLNGACGFGIYRARNLSSVFTGANSSVMGERNNPSAENMVAR